MQSNPSICHQFLQEFKSQYLTKEQLDKFAIQWYKTAKAHKEAFPSLVYNTFDDEIRFELIDILNEEYGNGNREQMHVKLLKRFLYALDITDEQVETTKTLPAIEQFSKEILAIWKDGNSIYAFGLHFALEFLAATFHVYFANGLAKYSFLSDYDREYFNYHKVAEQRHSDFSENGFLSYAATPENQQLLERGIDKGIELLNNFWDEYWTHIFGSSEQISLVLSGN